MHFSLLNIDVDTKYHPTHTKYESFSSKWTFHLFYNTKCYEFFNFQRKSFFLQTYTIFFFFKTQQSQINYKFFFYNFFLLFLNC
jgi:hypothetical protein